MRGQSGFRGEEHAFIVQKIRVWFPKAYVRQLTAPVGYDTSDFLGYENTRTYPHTDLHIHLTKIIQVNILK